MQPGLRRRQGEDVPGPVRYGAGVKYAKYCERFVALDGVWPSAAVPEVHEGSEGGGQLTHCCGHPALGSMFPGLFPVFPLQAERKRGLAKE